MAQLMKGAHSCWHCGVLDADPTTCPTAVITGEDVTAKIALVLQYAASHAMEPRSLDQQAHLE